MVVRIFNDKLQEFIKDIMERHIFGPVLTLLYSIEEQKHGMPHAHILLTLDPEKVGGYEL